ncbi:putative SOS response-associated peptidase YedK [Neorhizobium huautlense]|uniref:Abasic site processing protein n=1 Tax=Neorhizobium huautlense TaxID=67774 RepID=A0ABT9PXE7_9HYPH|nr:SOS response-associated peptidase [Neorhizobium huautlense]MDP9839155.1 putative SOS response-associated peptidase YedK [Neorhizobium huautlense]
MCGRYALTSKPDEVLDFTGVAALDDFPARFNIAPTQPILVVMQAERSDPGSNLPDRRAFLARWGFIPGWAKDPKDLSLMINARSESAIGKPSFRAAMRHRRILVPASGFYEWRRQEKSGEEKSQPYWIRPKNGALIAFGGLMETYASADGSEIDTAAILTTGANRALSRIHDRMPVVIGQEDFTRWLDCRLQEPREVKDLMKAVDDDFFEAIPVSDRVNKVSNMGAELQLPAEDVAPLPAIRQKSKPDDSQLSLF